MRSFLKNIFFSSSKPNRILSGVSSGMLTNYDPKNRTMHLMGLYEREIYPFINEGIDRAGTLIDIGANDGYYGLAFAKKKGKKIILCEPQVTERENLVNNLALNGISIDRDYQLVDKFVGNKSDENEISLNDLIDNKSSVFILMDVDGAEDNIVKAFDFQTASNVDWLVETHSVELEKSVVSTLEHNGYKVSIIDKAWWRKFVPENRPLAHNRWLFATKR